MPAASMSARNEYIANRSGLQPCCWFHRDIQNPRNCRSYHRCIQIFIQFPLSFLPLCHYYSQSCRCRTSNSEKIKVKKHTEIATKHFVQLGLQPLASNVVNTARNVQQNRMQLLKMYLKIHTALLMFSTTKKNIYQFLFCFN